MVPQTVRWRVPSPQNIARELDWVAILFYKIHQISARSNPSDRHWQQKTSPASAQCCSWKVGILFLLYLRSLQCCRENLLRRRISRLRCRSLRSHLLPIRHHLCLGSSLHHLNKFLDIIFRNATSLALSSRALLILLLSWSSLLDISIFFHNTSLATCLILRWILLWSTVWNLLPECFLWRP